MISERSAGSQTMAEAGKGGFVHDRLWRGCLTLIGRYIEFSSAPVEGGFSQYTDYLGAVGCEHEAIEVFD